MKRGGTPCSDLACLRDLRLRCPLVFFASPSFFGPSRQSDRVGLDTGSELDCVEADSSLRRPSIFTSSPSFFGPSRKSDSVGLDTTELDCVDVLDSPLLA